MHMKGNRKKPAIKENGEIFETNSFHYTITFDVKKMKGVLMVMQPLFPDAMMPVGLLFQKVKSLRLLPHRKNHYR